MKPVATPPNPPALEARRLSVRFGGIHALSDVSLACAAGEVMAVIGPNGAGKSTLFNAICGICRPRTGSVSVAGRDVCHQRRLSYGICAAALVLGLGAALLLANVDSLWRHSVVEPFRARVLAQRRGEPPPPSLHVAEHLWRDIGAAPRVHAERGAFVVCDGDRVLLRAPTLALAEAQRDQAQAAQQRHVQGRQLAFLARASALVGVALLALLRVRRQTSWSPRALARAGVARTFQNIRLFDDLTAEDNVRVVFEQHGGDLAKRPASTHKGASVATEAGARAPTRAEALHEDIQRLLHEVDLVGRGKVRAGDLSYGERRRLEIARALALRPAVLLLDEPAAGMHAGETAALLRLFRRLKAANMAVVLIEHDMSLVMEVSDHVLVLDHGAPIASGTPAAVRRDAKVIAAYLGEDPGPQVQYAAQQAIEEKSVC